MQRLLTSHPQILIWGEQGGHLSKFLAESDVLRAWDDNVARHGLDAFDVDAHHGWLANMLSGADAIDAAVRAYIEALFAEPARVRGRPSWGFKEVRLDRSHMLALRRVFSELRVVHITRDPRDVLRSLDAWERADEFWQRDYSLIAVDSWRTVNESFIGCTDDWVLSVRYEDVIAEPQRFVDDVATLIDADAADFDSTVFDRKVRDYQGTSPDPRSWSELPADLRALLADARLQSVAAAYSYDL